MSRRATAAVRRRRPAAVRLGARCAAGWDEAGRLSTVQAGVAALAGVPLAAGAVLPGMANLHSHAFQRAFAGLTEHRTGSDDSFWSWRTLMYRFALRLTPEALEAIATQLYVEMLRAGYTSVCEFHYVHHDPDGSPCRPSRDVAAPAARGRARRHRHHAAAGAVPDRRLRRRPALPEQRRFLLGTDAMMGLLQRLAGECDGDRARLGLAPHSLRAVPPQALAEAVAGLHALDAQAPHPYRRAAARGR